MSGSPTTVAPTDAGGNVTISLPTQLSASTWSSLLDGEFIANGSDGRIVTINVTPIADSAFDRLTIELGPDTTYELRLAKVGLGGGGPALETGYVVDVAGNNSKFSIDGEQELVAEVRNRFNSPQSGARITFTTDDGAFHDGGTETTVTNDVNGRASVAFTSSVTGNATVRAGIDQTGDDSLIDEPSNLTVAFHLKIQQLRSESKYTLNDPTDAVLIESEITGGRGNDPTFLNVTFANAAATTHHQAASYRLLLFGRYGSSCELDDDSVRSRPSFD